MNRALEKKIDHSLALVAGEPSGDLLGSFLLQALQTKLPVSTYGIGGAHMLEKGFCAHWPIEKLAVRGYVEALKHIREILAIRRLLRDQLLTHPPLGFIGIDAPDFNLSLECDLRRAGIPVIHFVSPSIWAWRANRIKKIARAVDHMLCIFPFEKAIYDRANIPATYVGHPLAQQIPLTIDQHAARHQLGLADNSPVVAVLPGSRLSEIQALMPVFCAAMRLLKQAEPKMQFVVPIATAGLTDVVQQVCQTYADLDIHFLQGQAHTAMAAADTVLLASGTATLEVALHKKPMVIAYKVPWLTAQIMKRQGYLPYIGLPNILAGRFVVPELLQDAVTPQALATEVLRLLNDVEQHQRLSEIFHEIHISLQRDTGNLAAQVVVDVLTQHGRI